MFILQKTGITFDQNNISNRFRSNEDGAELFSMIVHLNKTLELVRLWFHFESIDCLERMMLRGVCIAVWLWVIATMCHSLLLSVQWCKVGLVKRHVDIPIPWLIQYYSFIEMCHKSLYAPIFVLLWFIGDDIKCCSSFSVIFFHLFSFVHSIYPHLSTDFISNVYKSLKIPTSSFPTFFFYSCLPTHLFLSLIFPFILLSLSTIFLPSLSLLPIHFDKTLPNPYIIIRCGLLCGVLD